MLSSAHIKKFSALLPRFAAISPRLVALCPQLAALISRPAACFPRLSAFLPFFLVAAAGCSGDVDNTYSSEAAFFRFTPVTAASPLYSALNNPGVFCSVKLKSVVYHFSLADGKNSSTYTATALMQSYGRPVWGAGMIVGTLSVPEISGSTSPVAYELACPACYAASSLQIALTFSGTEELTCSRCARVFDLANSGIEKGGAKDATHLLRYRLTYAKDRDMVVVQN